MFWEGLLVMQSLASGLLGTPYLRAGVVGVESGDELGILAAVVDHHLHARSIGSPALRTNGATHVHAGLRKDRGHAGSKCLCDEARAVLLVHVGRSVAVDRHDVVAGSRVVVGWQHGAGA